MRFNLRYIFLLVILIILGLAVYYTFIYSPECQTFACFQDYMQRCRRASYISEETDASWKYSIKGSSDNQCDINVQLLQAKEGELQIEKLAGYSMDCYYPKGIGTYPQKDLNQCHGRLKEELQALLINKLHSHILENLGKISEELNKAI
jgi:hypothetical protein